MTDPQPFFNEAADLIENCGWCQEEEHSDDGRFCVLGALAVVGPAIVPAWWQDVLRARVGAAGYTTPRQSIVLWNDTPGRTAEEAIALLRDKLVPVVKR